MKKIFIAISFTVIIFFSSIPIAAIADSIKIIDTEIEVENNKIMTLEKKNFDNFFYLFICGKISNLEIVEKEINADITQYKLDFFAEQVYVRGGHPPVPIGWGVIPPKYIDEWVNQENVSVTFEENKEYSFETIGTINENFIFLFQLSSGLPFARLMSILWIVIAPFLNNIYPYVEPLIIIIAGFILHIWNKIIHTQLYINLYHAFDPLRDLCWYIRESLIPSLINIIFERWIELRHIIDPV